MPASGAGTSWPLVIGCISSSIAIIIFITGRNTLAELLGIRKPPFSAPIQQEEKKSGKLIAFLNRPIFLLIGLFSSIVSIYAFYTASPSININHQVTNINQFAKETPPDNTKKTSESAPAKKLPTRAAVAPLKGIEIVNNDNAVDAAATEAFTSIVEQHGSTIIRGQLTVSGNIIDSTATTKIKAYKVVLALKIYKDDGIRQCATRFFETTIHADDITSVDKIKKQALAEFIRTITEQPGKIACH